MSDERAKDRRKKYITPAPAVVKDEQLVIQVNLHRYHWQSGGVDSPFGQP